MSTLTKITVLPHSDICPQGAVFQIEAGTTVCDSLLRNGIHLEHACEKVCACTTCHVIVREGYNSLNVIEDAEEDLLDMAWGLSPQSRLSCQAVIGEQALTIELPKYTRNHASEG
jgi:ferredoxin, 2Fe-2S